MLSQSVLIQFDQNFLPDFERKIADSLSLYSNPFAQTGQMSRQISSARQAMIVLFITTLRPYWETDNLVRSIGQKAYLLNYEGKWEEVQRFLENYQPNPHWFIELYLETHSTNDFFGNFLPRVKKEINFVRIKSYVPFERELPPLKRKVRRRGYNDKGHLRLSHENHGDRPVQERDDRRPMINHPLLKDLSRRIIWDEHTSSEGGD